VKISNIIQHIIGLISLVLWLFVFLGVKGSLIMLLIFIALFLMLISLFESISIYKSTPRIRKHTRKRFSGEYF
jgi:hypothetical protein